MSKFQKALNLLNAHFYFLKFQLNKPKRLVKSKNIASSKPRIVWVSQYYNITNKTRRKEVDACFFFNSSLEYVSKTIIFSENNAIPALSNNDNSISVPISNRCDFALIFDHLKSLEFTEDTVFILTNSDIFLSPNLSKLLPTLASNDFLSLTRYESFDDPKPFLTRYPVLGKHSNTQDSWIFTGNFLRINSFNTSPRIFLGTPGCENALIYFLHQKGIRVWNLAMDIRTYHNHISDLRNYSEVNRVKLPYAYPVITSLANYYLDQYIPPIIDYSYI